LERKLQRAYARRSGPIVWPNLDVPYLIANRFLGKISFFTLARATRKGFSALMKSCPRNAKHQWWRCSVESGLVEG